LNVKKQSSTVRKLIQGTFGRAWVEINNHYRRDVDDIGYILFSLPDAMPALPQPRGLVRRRILGEPPLSLWELERRFHRIADDPRPTGVILYLRGFAMSLADLQTLRGGITRLREAGKRVVCFAQGYDLATYYVASAADEIIIQPGGTVFTIGLRQEATFLKDALARVGVEVDSVAISPYKGAADSLTRDDISEEGRAQLEWLLDNRYGQIIEGIAEGRGFTVEKIREMIDNAPYLDTFAKGVAMVDAICTEEELYTYLNTKHITPWEEADKKVYLKFREPHEQYVALLTVEGVMVQGESANPPGESPIPIPVVGSGRAGDVTVVRQVRALMEDENLGAVVLYIDSGGGSATAAEAMTSALNELAARVPLIVYMNGAAASGGYYIATAAQHIVAQPGTITGSIGVLLFKPVAGGLRDMLRINAVEFKRGQNADIFSGTQRFSDDQRVWLRESIERTYDLFLERVARARHMEKDAVDAVGGGRVWTGAQALENGLVDELGDLRTAIDRARERAGLPADAPVGLVRGKTKPLAPQVAEGANPAAYLSYLQRGVALTLDAQPQTLTPLTIHDKV
jgi:protease IV